MAGAEANGANPARRADNPRRMRETSRDHPASTYRPESGARLNDFSVKLSPADTKPSETTQVDVSWSRTFPTPRRGFGRDESGFDEPYGKADLALDPALRRGDRPYGLLRTGN